MNERQRRFAEFYAINPNAAEAAKAAGYSQKTARTIGAKLLTNVDIVKYIRELQDKAAEPRISSMKQVKAFWADTMNDTKEKTADRLKASELLAKAAGAFIHNASNSEDDNGGGEEFDDVIIYLPEIKTEER